MTTPPAAVRARILEAARQKPSPTRQVLERRRLLALAFSGLWVAGVALTMHAHLPPYGGLVLLGVWALFALGATAFVFFAPRRRATGVPRGALRGLAPVIAIAVMLGTVVIGEAWGHQSVIPNHHVQCLVASGVVGAGPVAAALWVERGSDPIAPGATGAGFGAIAGAWSGVAMSFVCGRTEPLHTLVAHVAALALLTIVAGYAGRRLLALR